jgi:hypothetical protein
MGYRLESLEWRTLSFVADQVFAKAERLGAEALNEAERAFWIVWIADGHIVGGTIYRLFHLCPELLDTLVGAYQALRMFNKANIIAHMLALLPAPSFSEEERLKQVEGIQGDEPSRDDHIQRLHDDYYHSDEETDIAAYTFVQEHRSEFLYEE